jgi:hypothetical protein
VGQPRAGPDAGVVDEQRGVASDRGRLRDRVLVGDVQAERRDARDLNALGVARRGVHLLGAALEQLHDELTPEPAVGAGDDGH